MDNETLDDRALDGVWLGNDLTTPMFWMYSFKLRKVVRLSDPRHFDHILPFLCPDDIPHRIDLSADDICTMHEEDGDKVERMPVRKSTRFRVTASGSQSLFLLRLTRQMSIRGRIRGSQMRGSRILGRMPEQKNRHLSRNTRRCWAQRITNASNMAKTCLLMQSFNI